MQNTFFKKLCSLNELNWDMQPPITGIGNSFQFSTFNQFLILKENELIFTHEKHQCNRHVLKVMHS